jgi:2-C-methyl-D-erythritol 4-phosphate cytidylyltransferase
MAATDPNSSPAFAVILPAAGLSRRFGADKLRASLAGSAVLWRTIDAFARRVGTDVASIVLAVPGGVDVWDGAPADIVALRDTGALQAVEGGPSRAHSVLNALRGVPDSVEFVAVHDAARPLVSQALIDRAFAHARTHGSAIPALPVKLTIKQATGPLPAAVQRTLPRSTLWEMQTPQVARRRDLLDAFARCPLPLDQVTDDGQLLELAGLTVWLVEGEERNLKLTTPQDLLLAEQLLTAGA